MVTPPPIDRPTMAVLSASTYRSFSSARTALMLSCAYASRSSRSRSLAGSPAAWPR